MDTHTESTRQVWIIAQYDSDYYIGHMPTPVAVASSAERAAEIAAELNRRAKHSDNEYEVLDPELLDRMPSLEEIPESKPRPPLTPEQQKLVQAFEPLRRQQLHSLLSRDFTWGPLTRAAHEEASQ